MKMDEIEAVVLHPPVAQHFTGSEHPLGQLSLLGDALGVDCLVREFVDGWMRARVGAWRREKPLQIRFDPAAMGKLRQGP